MTVEIVAFKTKIKSVTKLTETLRMINESDSDLILFAGHTLDSFDQVYQLTGQLHNTKSLCILEIRQRPFAQNSLFMIKDGELQDLMTNQKFATSDEITGNPFLCSSFLKELEERRTIHSGNNNILVLQCGENNIIRNVQKEGNRAVFNHEDDSVLNARWNTLLSNCNVILNPTHSVMGNQGKLSRRREYLSSGGRAYFSVSNTDEFSMKSSHYAYVDGKPIDPIREHSTGTRSYSWIYEI